MILQSSAALEPSWGPITPEHALLYSNMLASSLGCTQVSNELRLSCMQNKEMLEILALTFLMGDGTVWMAVPDANFTSKPFLPKHPEDLMSSGMFNTNVDVMIGSTADEGM